MTGNSHAGIQSSQEDARISSQVSDIGDYSLRLFLCSVDAMGSDLYNRKATKLPEIGKDIEIEPDFSNLTDVNKVH